MLSFLRKPSSRAKASSSSLPALANAGVAAGSATWKVVLALAWPVLAQQCLILLVTLSDSFLAGHFEPLPPDQQARAVAHQFAAFSTLAGNPPGLGPVGFVQTMPSLSVAQAILAKHIEYQAAQTTAHYLAWMIASYCVFVSVGSTALVARFMGGGDRQAAIHVTNQSILLAVALGVAGTVAGLLGMDQLISLLQLKGETAALAVAYLRPLFALLTFQVIEAAGIACLIGAGDTRTGLWVRAGVAVVNLPLAWALFHGFGPLPALRFEGIALGTALSNFMGGMVVLVVLARGRAGLGLSLRFLRPDWSMMRRLLRISVPAGIDSLSVVVGQLWFLTIVNGLGDTASGAHGIALRWEALGYLSGAAFGTAAMTLVGQNLGAKQPDQAARSGWVAFGLGAMVMCTMGLVFFLLAPEMFALFCGGAEERPVIEAGVPVLRLVAFAMPALSCCIIFTYALRGAGDTRVPMLFTWIGFLGVRVPLAYLLTSTAFDWTFIDAAPGGSNRLFGAWVAMFADILVRGGFFLYRFSSGRWKSVRV